MSGGFFDYKQYCCHDMAFDIQREIEHNKDDYSENALILLKRCHDSLLLAGLMAHRADWFISGDDDESEFALRTLEDMESANFYNKECFTSE